VRSSVRCFLNRGAKDAPAYSGHTAWRAILPAESVPATLRRRESHLWLSAGAHVVHYPLRDASIISAVVIVEDGLRAPGTGGHRRWTARPCCAKPALPLAMRTCGS